jgi:hypothetical protein
VTKNDCTEIGRVLSLTRMKLPSGDGRRAQLSTPEAVFAHVVDGLCTAFKRDNHAFNEGRFRSFVNGECGPNGGSIK